MMASPPIVLCFSGSDPSGGAGIQADLAAIHHLGAHCAGVITALTIQNTANVLDFYPTPPAILLQQADALMEDMPIKVIKIGMIGSLENVSALSEWLAQYPHIPVILDPVLVASGGGTLAQENMAALMKEQLFPRTTLITPNTEEARQLAPAAANLEKVAAELLTYGCQQVLITGGDESTPDVTNLLYNYAGLMQAYHWPRLPHSYHGSGCTLAASIAALLALDFSLTEAVQRAQAYTWECLARAYQPGKGQYIPNRGHGEISQ